MKFITILFIWYQMDIILMATEVNVCDKKYTKTDYAQCGATNTYYVKECCPGWFDPKGQLNCSKAVETFRFVGSCDDRMWLFVDGREVLKYNIWEGDGKATIPGPSQVIAIKCYNMKGQDGIRAKIYTNPLIITDSSWKCSGHYYSGWTSPQYDDAHWGNAKVKTHYKHKPSRPRGWIWPHGGSDYAHCRRKLVPKCPAITNCQQVICSNKYDNLCVRCKGDHGTEFGDKAFVHSNDGRYCYKMCSWRPDSSRCYPGTCSPVSIYSVNCNCSPGFTGKHCQNINKESTIHYNELRLEDSNREYVVAPRNINSADQQPAVWSNLINPVKIKYKFTVDFQLKDPPCRPSYVKEFKVGIVSGGTTLRHITFCAETNRTCDGKSLFSEVKNTCFVSNSELNPSRQIKDCHNTLTNFTGLTSPFQHKDSLKLIFVVKNGGFIKIENKDKNKNETFKYNGATTTRTITIRFDIVKPYHCFPASDCKLLMVSDTDGTKNTSYKISWNGWHDDDSTISHYKSTVFGLKLKHNELEEHERTLDNNRTKLNSEVLKFITPGIYSLIFTVFDYAGNHRSARRIVIVDPVSEITTTHDSHLRVATAEASTLYTWQQTLSGVTITWNKRYINTVHHHGGYLAEVKTHPGVDAEYDDNVGIRTTKPIDNIQGIIKYESYFKVDSKGGSSIKQPLDSDFTNTGNLEQAVTLKPLLHDGDTLIYFIRAYDILTNYKEESVIVYFDSSPPFIENLWLTKGDHLNIAVHGFDDLSKMNVEWEAYDVHSGLEAVEWILYSNYSGSSILHGKQSISPQGEAQTKEKCEEKYNNHVRGPDCYCTPAVGCYHKHFQIHLNVSTIEGGGLIHNMSKGTHDQDYFVEITVINHAKLQSVLRYQITIDTSPPHEGHVHDGKTGHPEVDFQDDLQLFAHWDGFFDKESGVRFYQYGFSLKCLTADQFNSDLSKTQAINQTTSTSTSWTAPSVGKYYITVVAFNHAYEPSQPVCSDGVTIDITKPMVSGIYVDGVIIESGLIKKDNHVYFVNTNRQIYQIPNPDAQCIIKATEASDILLYPTEQFPDKNFHGRDLCKEKPLQSDFLTKSYLSKHSHIYVNWTGVDNESGIYDYEFGLASDRDSSDAPDLFPYISTNHHPWYKGHHLKLNDGTEFLICIKSINKAELSTIQVLGPIIVHTTAPVFKGDINVFINDRYLVAYWTSASVKDQEHTRISYTAALGTSPGGQEIQHYSPLTSGSSCQSTDPPSCTVFPVDELTRNLHDKNSYYVSLKLVNIVGLHTVAVSKPYFNKNRIPTEGVVIDDGTIGIIGAVVGVLLCVCVTFIILYLIQKRKLKVKQSDAINEHINIDQLNPAEPEENSRQATVSTLTTDSGYIDMSPGHNSRKAPETSPTSNAVYEIITSDYEKATPYENIANGNESATPYENMAIDIDSKRATHYDQIAAGRETAPFCCGNDYANLETTA